MDAARAAFTAAGARLNPLRSLEDVAAFFLAAGTFTIDTPGRSARVAARMGGYFDAMTTMLTPLLDAVCSMPIVRTLLASLPAQKGMTLITDKAACVICGGCLSIEANAAGISMPLFSATGAKTVQIFHKKCAACGVEKCAISAPHGYICVSPMRPLRPLRPLRRRIQNSDFRLQTSDFRLHGWREPRRQPQNSEFRIQNSDFRVHGWREPGQAASEFRIQTSELRLQSRQLERAGRLGKRVFLL